MMETLKNLIKDNTFLSKILKLGFQDDLKIIFKSAALNINSRVIFDVGANVGDYTLDFMRYFPKAQIWAFEPCKETFELLKWKLRKYMSRIKLFELGIFNENAEKELFVTNYHPSHSLMPMHEDFKKTHENIRELKKQKIKVVRLDDFVMQHKIKHVDIIKIDVEGVEYEVLEGGMDTLKNKTDSVIIEISLIRKGRKSGHFIKIFEFLNDCGFYLRDIYNLDKFKTGSQVFLSEMNCIFKR